MNVEPTRERVEAYEKALGCYQARSGDGQPLGWCVAHGPNGWDLGCPAAVAAARVEAERVRAAKVEALREAAGTLSERTEGPGRAGTAKWSEDYRDAYSLAIEEASGAMSRSADEIERGDR